MDYTEALDSTQINNSELENSTILNRVQVKAALNAIHTLGSSTRPKQVLNAFDLVVLNLRENTGEVMLTRYQLAQGIGCSLANVRHIMCTLVHLGVVIRERRCIKGKRGSGITIYFVNPHIAWKGDFLAFKVKTTELKPPFPSL